MSETLSYLCPFCDREVRVGEPCPGCAKKQKSATRKKRKPWQQDRMHDGHGLPDDEFDYDEFTAREFGHLPHRKIGVKWYWWLLGVLLLVVLGAAAIGFCW